MELRTIDLDFQGVPGAIAAFAVRGPGGWLLVETGPGSTDAALVRRLEELGVDPQEVADVFVTHIHFDHAGAAGLWTRRGARLHVHRNGAAHLIDPSKLIASATRIYGERMDTLWGAIVPADPEKMRIVTDGEEIRAAGLTVKVIESRGHAEHHHAYRIGDLVFTGDAAGVRIAGTDYVDLPAPPPEFQRETWDATLERLFAELPATLVLTHFGPVADGRAHLERFREQLHGCSEAVGEWMREGCARDEIARRYTELCRERALAAGLDDAAARQVELANPRDMSVTGIVRYWHKVHGLPLPS